VKSIFEGGLSYVRMTQFLLASSIVQYILSWIFREFRFDRGNLSGQLRLAFGGCGYWPRRWSDAVLPYGLVRVSKRGLGQRPQPTPGSGVQRVHHFGARFR
jgi:hypothetical protein